MFWLWSLFVQFLCFHLAFDLVCMARVLEANCWVSAPSRTLVLALLMLNSANDRTWFAAGDGDYHSSCVGITWHLKSCKPWRMDCCVGRVRPSKRARYPCRWGLTGVWLMKLSMCRGRNKDEMDLAVQLKEFWMLVVIVRH